jgi:hypothetical protein
VFWVNGNHEVVVEYNPTRLRLVRVKELIVNKLKEGYPREFRNAAWGYLTLKTMNNAEITSIDDISKGGEFKAEFKRKKTSMSIPWLILFQMKKSMRS